MNKFLFVLSLGAAFAMGAAVARFAPVTASAASTTPTLGWNLHIDAQKHFGEAHPAEIAHHWCKPVSGGMTECQIYDSDAPDAHLVAIETIVSPATYNSFPASEQALWHYHKTEIPKVNATLPDMTPDQAKKTVASMEDTYGKVWLLYDPMSTGNMPTGQPSITVLK